MLYIVSKGERVNTQSARNIYGITRDTKIMLRGNQFDCTFVITALDRLQNESKGIKVKL